MRLQQLLKNVSCQVVGNDDIDILSLSCDTATVQQNCLFFCLVGKKYDGHKFVAKAVSDGAIAVVTQKKLATKRTQIIVEDSRIAMSLIAQNFYDNCADKMNVISIVGTNGKTTTSYVLDAILTKANYNVGVIGTNGIFFGGKKHYNNLTTPDPIQLNYWLKQMYLKKVNYVIIEVSAHAIALNKMYGIKSKVTIFTNFSQDHLDYFGNMSCYKNTKKSFFTKQNTQYVVSNIDDELGREIAKSFENVLTYSVCNGDANCFASNLQIQDKQNSYLATVCGKSVNVITRLVGKFNVYNTLSAIACAVLLGVDADTCAGAVGDIQFVDGRNQTLFRSDGVRVVIDFAHTPDGIKNILGYLKGITTGSLIVVFGCGGNRDKLKRPLMAEAVSSYADFAVITNDNPRYEEPQLIVRDICENMSCQHKTIFNRSQATEFALSIAKAGDTVAVLGKGAEDYQEIKGRRYHYSDLEVVTELIE